MLFKTIILNTERLNVLEHFYGTLLNLPCTTGNNEIRIQAGYTELIFRSVTYSVPPVHIAFNIPGNHLGYSVQWLLKRTSLLPVSEKNYIAEFHDWKAKAVYFSDPAGNILEFITREGLDILSTEKFSGESIISVSELGVVVSSTESFADEIMVKAGIPPFPQGVAPGKDFAAFGDDNGLFIAVPVNRSWFPTQIPAQRFEYSAEFFSGAQKFIINSRNTIKEINAQ